MQKAKKQKSLNMRDFYICKKILYTVKSTKRIAQLITAVGEVIALLAFFAKSSLKSERLSAANRIIA